MFRHLQGLVSPATAVAQRAPTTSILVRHMAAATKLAPHSPYSEWREKRAVPVPFERDVPDLALNTIADRPGAKKVSKRVGRGIGSGKGKTCGKGHKGHNARTGGGPRPGFGAGAPGLYKSVKKSGFKNGMFRQEFLPFNLDRLQLLIDKGLIDPTQTITLRTLRTSGAFPKLSKPVKLLAEGKEFFAAKVNIEISACSEAAREAVEAAGGTVTTVYFNKLGLRTFIKNEPENIGIKFAAAPTKKAHRYDVTRYSLSSEQGAGSVLADQSQSATAQQ